MRPRPQRDLPRFPLSGFHDLGKLLDGAHVGVMVLDESLHAVYANDTLSGMLDWKDALRPDAPQPLCRFVAEETQCLEIGMALETQGAWQGLTRLRRTDGECLPMQFGLSALAGTGESLGFVGLFSPVSPESCVVPMPASAAPDQRKRLSRALAGDELTLFYQPKVNMRTGQVVGVEALLRWRHPEAGCLLPGEFLPQIEHDDLIIEIGEWVTRQALAQVAEWRRHRLDLKVSINIAARHLQCLNFSDSLGHALRAEPHARADQFEIEILESAALENTAHVKAVMATCRELGVSFSLDDFGTGYASLAYLREIPAEVLKIDRRFIQELMDNSDDLILVEGVISLARAFNRGVVAEGVESAEHGLMLMRLGCDIAQGFGIARPMPAEDIPGWVARYRPDPAWNLWADVPWKLDDFPLLVAKHDHLNWVERLMRMLDTDTPLLVGGELADHRKCRFGQWYYHHGKARYGHLPTFAALEGIHSNVHELGVEIVRLAQTGQAEAARRLTATLLDERDRILARLDELQHAVAHGPGQMAQAAMVYGSDGRALPQGIATGKRRRPRILVVDDTATNVRLLAGVLASEHDLRFAISGAKALELLEMADKPDLILLDVMMPGLDGYEVCRRLKDNPATRGIPVIFITAKSDPADQAHGFRLGAVDYISKPFDLEVVMARVRTHLNLKLRTDLLEAQAAIDALTGIANRRRFDEVLHAEWRRAERNIMPLSLLMLDVDYFKHYNDYYGHGAGDECLRQVAAVLQYADLRPGDFAARYGGEEFAVILPNCFGEGAQAVAERIRAIVEGLRLPHARSSCAPVVTVSVGCATVRPAEGGDASALFLAADQALYQAKSEGRNRVCCARRDRPSVSMGKSV